MSANPAFNRQFRAAAANYDNQSPLEDDSENELEPCDFAAAAARVQSALMEKYGSQYARFIGAEK